MRRSMMFLPGNSPSMLINGTILDADSIILDLEDAVAPDQKDAARLLVRNALAAFDFAGRERVIRINSIDTSDCFADLAAIVPHKPDAIMPPKMATREDLLRLVEEIDRLERASGLEEGSIAVIPLIETALGVENAFAIATASTRVAALFLGGEDLSADLRSARTKKGDEIFYARTRLLMAARAAGIEAIDTPFTDTDDIEGLRADCAFVRGLGFSGKAVISPRHLAFVNAAFSPTEAELRWAEEVMEVIAEGKAQGKGAVSLRGKMIDKPIVQRAETYLKMAEAIAQKAQA